MKGFPDLPPIWWIGSIGLIYGFELLLPALHFVVIGQVVLSTVLMILAFGIIGWAVIWFRRKKTPIEPHHRPKALIKEGPYVLSRNPIYLAFVLLTVSFAIAFGSLLGLAIAFALWYVLDRRFARAEEGWLRQEFGAEAEAYISKTKRWI